MYVCMAECGRAVVGGTGASEARGLCGISAICGEIVVTIYGRFAPLSVRPMSRNTTPRAPRTPLVRFSVRVVASTRVIFYYSSTR